MGHRAHGNKDIADASLKRINDKLERDLVLHGPHDEWPDRNKKGANCGPQVRNGNSMTAYVPDGNGQVRKVHLDSVEVLAEFYVAFGIDFKAIYGDAFGADGCEDLAGMVLDALLD